MSNSMESMKIDVQSVPTRGLDQEEIDRVTALRTAAIEERDRIAEAWRTGQLTHEEALAAEAKATWPKWSISTLGPCPPGCVTVHDPEGADDDLVGHEVEVVRIETMQPDRVAYVSWGFCDSLIEGKRCAAQVQVYGADEGLTPAGARQLAAALVDAARFAEEWNIDHGNVFVSRAVRALTVFGVLYRAEAASLLPMWRFNGELSDADRTAVLDQFPARVA